jgi:RNA polymerase sigma-70 factor (ECF subfamily)
MDDIEDILRAATQSIPGNAAGCRSRVPLRPTAGLHSSGNDGSSPTNKRGDRMGNSSSSGMDPSQFLRLFLENERRIYAFIVSILPNLADAEDILQETSILLWQKFDQFQPGSDFVAWACRIAQFRVMKFYERQRRSKLRFDLQAVEAIAKEVLAMGSVLDARHEALANCLEELTSRDRDLVQRRYADDASPQLISEQVGRSIHAIYKALTRIHDALLNCILRKLAQNKEQEHESGR